VQYRRCLLRQKGSPAPLSLSGFPVADAASLAKRTLFGKLFADAAFIGFFGEAVS
jgi:hypothetical protein